MRRPRGRWGAAGLLLAVVAGVAVLWWVRREAQPARAATPAAPPTPPVASAVPAASPDPLEPDARATLPEPVQRYLDSSVYPPGSGGLDEGATDLLEPNRRYERMRPAFGAEDARFLWTADAFRYASDERVEARFEAWRGEQPAELSLLEASAQPEGRAGASGEPVPLYFRREGAVHHADLDLSRELPDHHGPVALVARYAFGDDEPQQETIRIFVTPADRIPARFTGEFGDEVRDGSLLVEVGIEVDEPGFYRIDGNLYDAGGEPVAWAAHKGELGPGDRVVALRFFGKVLRDAGRPGPYRLRQLRGYLFRDGQFPDRLELRDPPATHTTRAWPLSAFSDREWEGEHRRRMVQLMLEDESRGIPLEQPPPATGPAQVR